NCQSKLNKLSGLKSVSCFIGPPSSGRLHRLEVPVRLSAMTSDFPSGNQPGAKPEVESGTSIDFVGGPPSTGKRIILAGEFGSSLRYRHAIHFPSGEIEPPVMNKLLTWTGSPPSMDMRQSDILVVRQEVKKIDLLSGVMATR